MMEVVTKKQLRRIWTCVKLGIFLSFFVMSVIALTVIGLYGYANFAGPPPLQVPQTTVFYGNDGSEIGQTEHGGQNRYWVSLDEVADPLIQATLAVEDKRFYDHNGFDLKRIAGSAMANIKTMSKAEGASTITMQYARNLYLTTDKTWGRKLHEALYTMRLEANYTKKTILEGYLNTIYYGKDAYGIEAAAQYYFGKSAKHLNLAEASMLAGIPNAPGYYSPAYHKDQAKQRQRTVLQAMADADVIRQNKAEQAAAQSLDLVMETPDTQKKAAAPYFQDAVEDVLKTKLHLSPQLIKSGGLQVYTTLDPDLQSMAKKRIDETIANNAKIQSAMVAMNPQNGHVKALIGGRDYKKSPYNRATEAKRQPGSSFKPFLYYAAIANGLTPSTPMTSEPTTFHYDNGEKTYKPQNFGHYYANDFITLMQALALSDNIYAVKTHMSLGMEKLANTAEKVGITDPVKKLPSAALGTKPVSVLNMVRGYSALANGGYRVEPRFITKIVKPDGEVIFENEPERQQTLDPKAAFVDAQMMTGIFDESLNDYTTITGRTVNDYLHRQVAAKTGTTNTDSWMLGFTPKLAAGVWTGYDKGRVLDPNVDTQYSKKIWGHFMKNALQGHPKKPFEPPKGVVGVSVDPDSGKLATKDCPQRRYVYYIQGTQPTSYCQKHAQDPTPPEKQGPTPNKKENGLWQRLYDWLR